MSYIDFLFVIWQVRWRSSEPEVTSVCPKWLFVTCCSIVLAGIGMQLVMLCSGECSLHPGLKWHPPSTTLTYYSMCWTENCNLLQVYMLSCFSWWMCVFHFLCENCCMNHHGHAYFEKFEKGDQSWLYKFDWTIWALSHYHLIHICLTQWADSTSAPSL